jgi:hypothetical protein
MATKNKLFLTILFFCIFIRIFSVYPLNNTTIPGGTDVAFHLFQSWYITENGLTNWNKYWYGGYSFLRVYPFLFHALSGYIGKILGYLIAYKLVVNLFFILTPIAFYLFLQEFNFSTEKKYLALIFFSTIMIYHYYFSDGRHAALISVFFGILFWKFLKRTIEKKNYIKDLILSAFFIAVCSLVHQLTAFLFIIITFFWSISYSFKLKTLIKYFKIGILFFLLVCWWWVPFLIESSTSVKEQRTYVGLIEKEYSVERIKRYISFMKPFYVNPLAEYFIFSFIILAGLVIFLSLTKLEKINLSFWVVLILNFLLIIFIQYKRAFILVPITFSILLSDGLTKIENKNKKYFLILILVSLSVLTYFMINTYSYKIPEIPKIPNDGRVVYLPYGDAFQESGEELNGYYSVLLPPIYGQETITGWYPQAIITGRAGTEKLNYDNLLSNPREVATNEYYKLLSDGWVKYIVINKNYRELIEYFNSSKNFQIYNFTKNFIIFELKPKSTYFEVNGKEMVGNITRNSDSILITFICVNDSYIIVKERYDDNWITKLNNKNALMQPTKYGFMTTKINENGLCHLDLEFKPSNYYLIFNILSLITYIFLITYIIKYN